MINMLDDQSPPPLTGISRQEPGTDWPVSCGSRGGIWLCAEPHYGQTARAIDELRKQSFAIFSPMVWERRTKGERVRRIEVPMFPGYLFVRFDPSLGSWGRIKNTRGVRGLLMVNSRPAVLPDAAILMVASNATELNAEFEAKAKAIIPKGTTLRATKGPWAGFEGVCLWHEKDRIRVMLGLFGRDTPVEFSASEVEIVKPGDQAMAAPMWQRRR